MAKYSKKAQEKIGEVMHEFKKGELETSSGKKVTDRDQAVAIGISEAHQAGYKAPKQPDKKGSSSKKSDKGTSSKQKQSGKGKTGSGKADKKRSSK